MSVTPDKQWRVLITCPPMLGKMDEFRPIFAAKAVEPVCPSVVQTLNEAQLLGLVSQVDGWIIGDDPVTRRVLEAGRSGRLRAAVKWGIGTDNIDFAAAKDLGVPVLNTPGVFGKEVADLAVGYVIGLARQTFLIDRQIRAGGLTDSESRGGFGVDTSGGKTSGDSSGGGGWPKPCGISLAGKTVALVGLGDIGRNLARRLLALEMQVIAYDPYAQPPAPEAPEAPEVTSEASKGLWKGPWEGLRRISLAGWPDRLAEADFIVFTCALTPENRHMLNDRTLAVAKSGVRVVNVARGPLIDEAALIRGLQSGRVHSAALDVFETEPLPSDSLLRQFERCVFGSHNASNTHEAVIRASQEAIKRVFNLLGIN